MKFFKLKDFDFNNKRIIVRAGFDVPFDEEGNIADDLRIRKVIPTLEYLLKNNAKIIIISHNGRPDGKVVRELSMDKIGERIGRLLSKEIIKLNDCIGEGIKKRIMGLAGKEIILLENLRFHKEEEDRDIKVRDKFGEELASYADYYVNEAFANSHRDHASMTSIPKFIPGCAGLLLENELAVINRVIKNPKKPYVAIIGGAKAGKIDVINNMLKKVNKILIGGVLANTFLKANGYNIGNSLFDKESIDVAKRLANEKRIVLPSDFVIADKLDKNSNTKLVEISNIPNGWLIADIGDKTINYYKNILKNAKTIVFFGTMGIFEIDSFANGTKQLLAIMASSKADAIIGGGDSAAASDKFGLSNKMTHVLTGGGASLALFSGKELPAIKALEENYKKFKNLSQQM